MSFQWEGGSAEGGGMGADWKQKGVRKLWGVTAVYTGALQEAYAVANRLRLPSVEEVGVG